MLWDEREGIYMGSNLIKDRKKLSRSEYPAFGKERCHQQVVRFEQGFNTPRNKWENHGVEEFVDDIRFYPSSFLGG